MPYREIGDGVVDVACGTQLPWVPGESPGDPNFYRPRRSQAERRRMLQRRPEERLPQRARKTSQRGVAKKNKETYMYEVSWWSTRRDADVVDVIVRESAGVPLKLPDTGPRRRRRVLSGQSLENFQRPLRDFMHPAEEGLVVKRLPPLSHAGLSLAGKLVMARRLMCSK
jgi:hypothetical protein